VEVTVSIEITAEFSAGATDHVKHEVIENSPALGFRNVD